MVVFSHHDGEVRVDELGDDARSVSVALRDDSMQVPRRSITTSYPLFLIRATLDAVGPGFLCDEIARDEDPTYVQRILMSALLAYLDERSFDNARILDFGCGKWASTMLLARAFPSAELVGVELEEQSLHVARARAAHYGVSDRVHFHASLAGTSVPEGLGSFEFAVMSGVVEHLLPHERQPVLHAVWKMLSPGGVLFIDQTPNRAFPWELHTTRLPLINYAPPGLAIRVARYSRHVRPGLSWEALLRRGIRGATVRDLMQVLAAARAGHPVLLRPSRLDCHDRIDLWMRERESSSLRRRAAALAAKALRRLTGLEFVPTLQLAIRKCDAAGVGSSVPS